MTTEIPRPLSQQGPKPTRRQLFKAYWDEHKLVGSAAALLWTLVALGLLVLLVLAAYSKAVSSGYQWFAAAASVIILLWILFIVEGAELATATLLDKDIEQLNDERSKNTLRKVQGQTSNFFNGR